MSDETLSSENLRQMDARLEFCSRLDPEGVTLGAALRAMALHERFQKTINELELQQCK